MKRYSFFIACLSFISLFIYLKVNNKNNFPTPTEYIQKKKDKKKFKQDRKDWILDMHKSHPDDDWREIDRKNRKINTNLFIILIYKT